MAPFYKYGFFGDEMSLILAFVLGTGFGFFLERAGFKNIETSIVHREGKSPHFQTVLAMAEKV